MRKRFTVACAGALLVLTGCSGSDDGDTSAEGDDSGSGSGLTEVTIGVMPILDVAPLYLGVEQGIYEEHGIDLSFESAQGGAAIVPAVVSGEYDFGFSNTTSLMLAQTTGLELEVVSPGASSTGNPEDDFGAILVPEDSDLESVEDLEGHSVAINTLSNINDTLIRDAVDRAGGDSSAVEFVEIGHADMVAALESGQVDAIWEVEPFLTIGRDTGFRDLYSLYAEATPDLTVAVYFTTAAFAEEDPDTVDAFIEATAEALDYATENPDEARGVLTDYTEIDPEIIPELTLPAFPTEVNLESVEFVADAGAHYGVFARDEVDLEALFPRAQ
ncbi:ABC transporter substrate-binding protein [Georgenia sp. Z1491]|uniref:ABC transporter substrate-binding protein n=1 Tax=Georgenia sp. Z1491 TaxID=3416707 RepID=UPI003CF88254